MNEAAPLSATCAWCGSSLIAADGTWTDHGNSGDYCAEGLAVGPRGTSPHLPVLNAARAASPDLATLRNHEGCRLTVGDFEDCGWALVCESHEVRLLLATLDAARAASQGDEWLRVGRLTRALFAAMGWPTRRVPASSDDEGGGVGPFSAGLQTGDPDNPAWTALAEAVAREYAALAAAETP